MKKTKTNIQTEETQQDAFIREVDEDLKNESMKKLWDKYGLFITICVVVALSLAVSYESIKAWYIKRAENWSDTYAVALNLQNQGKYDESLAALNVIIDGKFGAFADLAKMQQVNVLSDQGKEEEAIIALGTIANDKDFNKQLRDLAIIKLASHKLDTATSEEIKNILEPIASDNAWYGTAQEMLAIVAVRDGNIEEAKNIYQSLLDNTSVSDELKNRVRDILSVL
ncbi:MAG: tetratricopeptide repeat protein [Alphaproteobacteria bacterium]|nr:tetratricopeptide repeat protein [Alphaproteobacteria bacterium]